MADVVIFPKHRMERERDERTPDEEAVFWLTCVWVDDGFRTFLRAIDDIERAGLQGDPRFAELYATREVVRRVWSLCAGLEPRRLPWRG